MLRSRFILRKKKKVKFEETKSRREYISIQFAAGCLLDCHVMWLFLWFADLSQLRPSALIHRLNWLSPVIYFQNTWHSFKTKDRRLKTGCSSIKRNLPLSFYRMWFRAQSSSGTSRLFFCCLERILFKSTREVLHLSNLWAPTYPVSAFLEKASMVVNTERRCILTFPFLTLWHGPKAGDTRDGGAHMHNYHSTAC